MRQNGGGQAGGADVWKGLAAGVVGGLVASWTMNQFQALWGKLSEEDQQGGQSQGGSSGQGAQGGGGAQEAQGAQQGGGQNGGQGDQKGGEESEDATLKTAEAISENVFGHELTKGEKEVAGPAVHYAFGSTMGALYGVASELWPRATAGEGVLFGTAVWLGADEAALPLLGLAKPPTEYPASKHVNALASHFVYGLTTDVVRRALRGTILR